tara:strand:- start:2038 stop:2445 length:408 start_codon:yes stop_codon:yes gene_type:complete
MKKLIIIVLALTLTSCGSTYNLSTDYRIKSILTITEKGDTLAVPIRDFKFRVLDSRILQIIDRNQFRYRQDWQRWNYNTYPIPHVNNRSNYNKPNIYVKPNNKPVVNSVIKPFKPYKPINTPVVKPVVKSNNKKN